MCGRFSMAVPLPALLSRFPVGRAPSSLTPRYNIAPSQKVPVILPINPNDGGLALEELRWGLIPSWAKDPAIGNRLINARAETLTEKASFKRPFQSRRCLVPADGFYEWRFTRTTKGKIPMRIRLKSQAPFAMAGLWERWKDAEGKELRTFTIITTGPNAVLEPIHNRMPVILKRQDEEAWLDPKVASTRLTALIAPYPAEEMEAYEVSKLINNAAVDTPDCIEPATPPPAPTLFDH
jgi:putative SOS response-associated peptidase YedK